MPMFNSPQPPDRAAGGHHLLDGAPQRIATPHGTPTAKTGWPRFHANGNKTAVRHAPRRPPAVKIELIEVPSGPRPRYSCDVVIPYYRNLQWVPEAIDSILRQRCVSTWLHLVNDDSPEADGWLKQRYARHHNILWYRNLKNLGPYRSLHQVWRRMRTPFLAIQDSDDISYPNRLWYSIDMLEREGGDMFGGGMEVFIEPDAGMIREVDRKYADRYPVWPSGQRWSTCPNGFLVNGTLVMRRSLFERLNGYHDLYCGGDVEFCTRASRTGAKQITSGAVVAARRVTGQSLSRSGEYAMDQPKRREIIERILSLYKQYDRPDFDPTRHGCLDRADPALTVPAPPEPSR